MTTSMTFDMCH